MAKQPANGSKSPAKSQQTPQKAAPKTESAEVAAPKVDAIPPELLPETLATAQQTTKSAEPPASPAQPKPAQAKPEASRPQEPKQPAAPAAKPQQGAGFAPLLLGGLVAGVIGFGVATLTSPPTDTALSGQVADQAAALAALQQQVSNQPLADLSAIETAQTALAAEIAALRGDLAAAISALDERTTALETQPRADGTGTPVDLGSYQGELDALRAQIAELTESARAELDTARAEAAAIEENAVAAARAAASRAALARLQTALESGAPLGAALGDLEAATGEAAPAALTAAQDGVPTLASLQDQFPAFARAALATARREGVAGEETGGFAAFLRDQFNVRSVTPREGSDADAILSRAGASLRNGRLTDTMAELSALPEVARGEMSEWLALAETRAAAVAAADTLSTSLGNN